MQISRSFATPQIRKAHKDREGGGVTRNLPGMASYLGTHPSVCPKHHGKPLSRGTKGDGSTTELFGIGIYVNFMGALCPAEHLCIPNQARHQLFFFCEKDICPSLGHLRYKIMMSRMHKTLTPTYPTLPTSPEPPGATCPGLFAQLNELCCVCQWIIYYFFRSDFWSIQQRSPPPLPSLSLSVFPPNSFARGWG